MKYRDLLLVLLTIFPAALFPQTAIDVPLSRQVLQDTAQFHGSKILTFTKPTATSITIPSHWTAVETAAIIDNPQLQPVIVIRFKNSDGVMGYALASDGKSIYDTASVLHFRDSGNREIADFTAVIRSRNDSNRTSRQIACQIVKSADRVIARIAECRQGILRLGERSYAIRLYAPSINGPFYSLSSDAVCLIDTNGDGNFSWKWQLADSGRTMVPSERVALTGPFSINGKKLRATEIDSVGSLLTCRYFEGDTSAAVGFKAPRFSCADISGTARNLSDMHGKIILITFWSTSCSYCEKIRPGLDSLVLRCDTASFQSIAAAADSDVKSMAAFLRDKPYEGIIMPYDSSLWNTYNRRMTTPVYYVIDRKGSIIFSGAGASLMPIAERVIMDLLQNP